MKKAQKAGHKTPPKRSLKEVVANLFDSDFKAAKRLYSASKYDADRIGLFIEVLGELGPKDRKKLYKMMEDDYESCMRMLKSCDIIEKETRNIIGIMVESEGPEDEICGRISEELKELVFEGKTRSIKTRKLAFDMLFENALDIVEVSKGILRSKNDIEMKYHALPAALGLDVSQKEMEGIIETFDSGMSDRYPLNEDVIEKLIEIAKSFGEKPDCVVSVLSKMMNTESIVRKILSGRAHEDEAKLAVSVILKRMKKASELGVEEYNKEAGATFVYLLSRESVKVRELTATGLELHIQEGNEFAKNVAESLVILADVFLSRPDFDMNIDAAEILYSLRFLQDAKNKIRSVALADLNDMANDKTYDKEKRRRAMEMLKKLGSVRYNKRPEVMEDEQQTA